MDGCSWRSGVFKFKFNSMSNWKSTKDGSPSGGGSGYTCRGE